VRVRATTAFVLIAGLAVLGAGCQADRASESAFDRLRAAGVVRIGYANEAPYAFRDSASGRVTGEAPEIARVVFAALGVPEVQGVLTEFGSLIPGLLAGRFDVIAAGMYVTPERCAQVAFSEPTYSVGEAFAVPAGNPLDLHGYEDLRDTDGATVGVVAGAIEGSYARAVGIPDDRIVTFPDALAALAGVGADRVSAYAGTALTVQNLVAKQGEDVEQALPFTDPVIADVSVRGYGAFAFRQDDIALRDAVNGQLSAFLGTLAHEALVAPFGFTTRQLPGSVTSSALCTGG